MEDEITTDAHERVALAVARLSGQLLSDGEDYDHIVGGIMIGAMHLMKAQVGEDGLAFFMRRTADRLDGAVRAEVR